MTAHPQKITLSASRDIPFNKLVLSQANVRRLKAGISIDELAEDIAHRTLLQSLNVRPVLNAKGEDTGMFEVPAGGRRYRALELLVKQKRMAKTQLVPCIVRRDGLAEEDSLAENVHREALHPLDQFRAFQALRDKGIGEEEIAARFFVTPAVVRQRLKLASVSEKLLDIYAEDGMTLEQLMAFTVTDDHARQEKVWESVSHAWDKQPYQIRRMLTEGAVRATDKRAQFVGIAAYEAAGGLVTRDLFEDDDGGWLEDAALLDRLASEKLAAKAETLCCEGWKWITVAPDFPYAHTAGLRRLAGEVAELTAEEQATYEALQAEYEKIQEGYSPDEDLPEPVDLRLAEIERAILRLEDRPVVYDPADVARAGVFVSIDSDGEPNIERGFMRPEDEPTSNAADAGAAENSVRDTGTLRTVITVGSGGLSEPETDDEESGMKPLSERLVKELTAQRTVALRNALGEAPDTAFLAVLHSLCLAAFYPGSSASCLEITAKSVAFTHHAPGLADTAAAKAIEARHEQWAKRLPQDEDGLWDELAGFDRESQNALFAHCAGRALNAVHEPWNRNPRRLVHADQVARAVQLDMASSWAPSVENFLGRVPKARILEAVSEARGNASAQLIDHLKKPDMAREAERLLAGTGWLPEPLRLREIEAANHDGDGEALPAFLDERQDENAAEQALPDSN